MPAPIPGSPAAGSRRTVSSSTAQATQTCKNSGGANWELYSGSPSPSVQTCEEGDAGCGANTETVGRPDTGPLHLLPEIHLPHFGGCFLGLCPGKAELSPPKPGLGLGSVTAAADSAAAVDSAEESTRPGASESGISRPSRA